MRTTPAGLPPPQKRDKSKHTGTKSLHILHRLRLTCTDGMVCNGTVQNVTVARVCPTGTLSNNATLNRQGWVFAGSPYQRNSGAPTGERVSP